MEIKAVFFDIDHTLLDFNRGAQKAMAILAERFGITFPENIFDIFNTINDPLWEAVQNGEITTDYLFSVRWKRIFAAAGVDGDGVAFEKEFLKMIAISAEKMEGAEELLHYLHAKYPLYIASNASYAQQSSRLKIAGFFDLFADIFVSGEIGYPKPRPEFFDACFEKCSDLKPGEILMVGDSLSADIEGARRSGMKTCWFNRDGMKPAPEILPDITVTKLTDLMNYI